MSSAGHPIPRNLLKRLRRACTSKPAALAAASLSQNSGARPDRVAPALTGHLSPRRKARGCRGMLDGPRPPLLAPTRIPGAFASWQQNTELQGLHHPEPTGARIAVEAPAGNGRAHARAPAAAARPAKRASRVQSAPCTPVIGPDFADTTHRRLGPAGTDQSSAPELGEPGASRAEMNGARSITNSSSTWPESSTKRERSVRAVTSRTTDPIRAIPFGA